MTIDEELFEWIYQFVDGKRHRKLLELLYNNQFISVIDLDDNRILDGVSVRYRFSDEVGIPHSVINKKLDSGVCSVLEMMLGLAIRAEENIVGDDDFGDRTIVWFWMMVKSLGLHGLTDDKFEEDFALHTVSRFLNRDYEASGKGGLFTIKDARKDMRDLEIWYQMNLFFESIL